MRILQNEFLENNFSAVVVWVGLDEVVVAGIGVGRGERAGGDHGEVQDGGWGQASRN